MFKKICASILALAICANLFVIPAAAASEDTLATQTTVHVSTVEELRAALQSNTLIILDTPEYTFKSLRLSNLENVTIQGSGKTQILTESCDVEVLDVSNCKGITLRNLVLGHDVPHDDYYDCNAEVDVIENSEVTFEHCDLFGCGTSGMGVINSNVLVKDSIIRDCTRQSMVLGTGAIVSCQNCLFSGNGYRYPNSYDYTFDTYTSSSYASRNSEFVTPKLTLSNCTFTNNKNPEFSKSSIDANQVLNKRAARAAAIRLKT